MVPNLVGNGFLLVLGGLLVGAGIYLHRNRSDANRQAVALVVVFTLFLATLLVLLD